MFAALGICLIAIFAWATVGFGFIKLSPEFYFIVIAPMMFCMGAYKIAEAFTKKRELFHNVISFLFGGWFFYMWYQACIGLDRMAQGLSPVVQEITAASVAQMTYAVIVGALVAFVTLWLREIYLKRRKI
jgi:hypothetical protein